MRTYQFLFFNARGQSPALEFADCSDDAAAASSAARQLGTHGTCSGVEIFEGDRLVVQLDRSSSSGFPMTARFGDRARNRAGQRNVP